MDQLNALTVGDTENRWSRQKTIRPILMYGAETEPARPVGHLGKETPQIVFHPTVKGTVSNPLDRKQETQGDDFTRIKVGLAMLFHSCHGMIYAAEQFRDKIFAGHEARSFAAVGLLSA
jgi:hypothetical protein